MHVLGDAVSETASFFKGLFTSDENNYDNLEINADVLSRIANRNNISRIKKYLPMIKRVYSEEIHDTDSPIDINLWLSIIRHESNFDPDAVGSAGELSFGQVLPETGNRILGIDNFQRRGRDPETNLRASIRYLKNIDEYLEENNWSYSMAGRKGKQRRLIGHYNAGESSNPVYWSAGTRRYVDTVYGGIYGDD